MDIPDSAKEMDAGNLSLNNTKRISVRVIEHNVISVRWIAPFLARCAQSDKALNFLLLIIGKQINMMPLGFRGSYFAD